MWEWRKPTLTLVRQLNGAITAVDLFPEFLVELKGRAGELELAGQIKTLQQSMDDLPFAREELDVIWSEGAIYLMGFENGIRQWRDFLKPGGYLAVSEITWITNTRPKAIEEFWEGAYPEIDLASNKIKILEENGYTLAGYFYLSEDSWMENYYKPLEARFDSFLEQHQNTPLAKKVVKEHREEMELYQQYKAYYSYGFYVARKN